MSTRKNCFGVLFTLACFAIGVPVAQGQSKAVGGPNESSDAGGSGVVPLTVQAGIPLDVALEKSVPIKRVGVPLEGHVVEPIYVFDHLVIPAGSQVLGHVTQVDNAPRKQRALAIANGNFTPLRTAKVDFDTLVLKDGTRLPLHTLVTQGAPRVVHLEAGGKEKKSKDASGRP